MVVSRLWRAISVLPSPDRRSGSRMDHGHRQFCSFDPVGRATSITGSLTVGRPGPPVMPQPETPALTSAPPLFIDPGRHPSTSSPHSTACATGAGLKALRPLRGRACARALTPDASPLARPRPGGEEQTRVSPPLDQSTPAGTTCKSGQPVSHSNCAPCLSVCHHRGAAGVIVDARARVCGA